MKMYDLVVIGGGPAGLAAAIEAKKEGINNILLIEREQELGGILQQCIHNGFGIQRFKEELTGPEYAERYINEFQSLSIEYKVNTMVIDMTHEKLISYMNETEGYVTIKAKAVILAMGCRERTRGAVHISGTRPAGIYNAGMAQLLVNQKGLKIGKRAIILGSGDIGLIMARRLTLEGIEVIGVLARGDHAAGLNRNVVQCLDDFKIPLLLKKTIVKINGHDRVSSVIVMDMDDQKQPIPGTEVKVVCDTVLFSVGLIPENELSIKAGVVLDRKSKGPIVDNNLSTNIEGVFACGNVLHVHDIVDYVSMESAKAGRSAAEYIFDHHLVYNHELKTESGQGIGYIVPQCIRLSSSIPTVELFMRTKKVLNDIQFSITLNNEVVQTFNRKHVTPSEMEKLVIPSTLLSGKAGVLKVDLIER